MRQSALPKAVYAIWALSQRGDGSPYVVTQVDPVKVEVHREGRASSPGASGVHARATNRSDSRFRVDRCGQDALSRRWRDRRHRTVRIAGERSARGIAADAHSLWLWSTEKDSQVVRFDLATNTVVRTLTDGRPRIYAQPCSR